MLALLAAFALVLAMAVPAFADDEKYTLTINNANGTYEAYQIFSGICLRMKLARKCCPIFSGAVVWKQQK